jgi:dihydrofolate reductase
MACQVHAFEPRKGGLFRVSLTYDAPTETGKTTAHTDAYHGRFVKLVPDASRPRELLEMQGGTTFHFITEGIHAALDRSKDVACGKDITLGGGAKVAQQYLKAGLIDEMNIHVVPVLLGDGTRLFENTDARQTDYECVRVVNSPSVSHHKYRRRQNSDGPMS